jgi:hypothetical protein
MTEFEGGQVKMPLVEWGTLARGMYAWAEASGEGFKMRMRVSGGEVVLSFDAFIVLYRALHQLLNGAEQREAAAEAGHLETMAAVEEQAMRLIAQVGGRPVPEGRMANPNREATLRAYQQAKLTAAGWDVLPLVDGEEGGET